MGGHGGRRRIRGCGPQRWQRCRRDAAVRVAADPHRIFAFLDFDFGDARAFEQLDQFFDLANVHRHGGGYR